MKMTMITTGNEEAGESARAGHVRGASAMRRAVVLAAALVVGFSIAAAPTPSRAEGTCGSRDNPCPMQKWMRATLGKANAAGDMTALAAGLDKTATMAPDASWNVGDAKTSWKGIAEAGAAAARAGDAAGVKASCKTCHDEWKAKYREKYRTKPVG